MQDFDANQVAYRTLQLATLTKARHGETPLQRMRRLGGFKAGTARAERFTTQELAEMARKSRRKPDTL